MILSSIIFILCASCSIKFIKICGTNVPSGFKLTTTTPELGLRQPTTPKSPAEWLQGQWSDAREPWATERNLRGCRQNAGCQSWEDPLTEDRLERAWYARGNQDRLDHFLRRLVERPGSANITVAVMGGSMTKGENTAITWATFFARAMRRQYPEAPTMNVWNLALGGSSSVKAVQEISQIIESMPELRRLDMVIVDYALNDGYQVDDEIVAGTEGLVNFVRRLDPEPALIYLETFRICSSLSDCTSHCDNYLYPGSFIVGGLFCSHAYFVQDVHELVTVPGKVPVISYRDVAWPTYYNFSGAFPTAASEADRSPFFSGSPHPSEVTHQLVADVLHYALQQRANELSQHVEPSAPLVELPYLSKDVCQPVRLKQRKESKLFFGNSSAHRRLWFSHGEERWSGHLDKVLVRMRRCSFPIRVMLVHDERSVWPGYFETMIRDYFGPNCTIFETAPSSTSRDVAFSFHSFPADLLVVALTAADSKAGLLEDEATLATNHLLNLAEELPSHPAIVYYETFEPAPSVNAARANCESINGRQVLREMPHLCPSDYRNPSRKVTVRRGIPIVSYTHGFWPILSEPPIRELLPSDERLAEFLLLALEGRARKALGCSNSTVQTKVPLRMFEEQEKREGLCPNKHRFTLSPFSSPSLEAAGKAIDSVSGSSGDGGGWKYFEDRPNKPGWIFNGTSVSELSFDVLSYDHATTRVTLGFLKSYGCYGKVQLWLGDIDPWSSSASHFTSACGLVVDGHWSDNTSLYHTTVFDPPKWCISGARRVKHASLVSLHIRPLVHSDDYIQGCIGAVNKFKVEYIGTCPHQWQ